MSEVASSYVTLMPSARGFGSSLSRQIGGDLDKAGSDGGKRFGRSFSSIAKGVIVGAAVYSGLTKSAGFAKDAIFVFNSTVEQSKIAFTTMLGSGKKAQTFLDKLQAFAKATPFEFEGLVKNSQLLLGMGIKSKQIIPYLTGLGDSVASVGGNADTLNNTILAFGQIASKGTLSMDNMNQLLQGGVPTALKVLASQFHVTTGEMVKMISTGKVSSDKALPLLVKGLEKGTKSTAALGGMMDKQSQTFGGAMSNISDALTQSIATAFRPFFNVASGGLQRFASFLGSSKFTNAAGKLTSALGTGMSTAGAIIKRLAPIVKSVFENQVIPAFNTAKRIAGQVAQAIANVWPVIKPLAMNLKSVMVAGFQEFIRIAQGAGNALGPVSQWIAQNKEPILAIGRALASAAKALIPFAPYAIGAFAAFKGAKVATEQVSNLKDKITNGIDTMKDYRDKFVSGVDAVKNFGSNVKSGIETVRLQAMYARDGAKAALSWARGMVASTGAAVRNTAVTTVNIARTIASRAVQLASAAAAKAMAADQWLVNAAMSANPIGLVVAALAALVGGFILAYKKSATFRRIVSAAFGAVKAVALDVAHFFTHDIPEAFMAIWHGLQKAWDAVYGLLKTWGPVALAVLFPFLGIPLLIWQHFSKIGGYIKTAFNAAIGFLSDAKNAVIGFFANAGTWLLDAGKNIMTGLWGAIQTWWTNASRNFGSIKDKVLGWLSGAGSWLANAGKDIIKGLWNAIKHWWSAEVRGFGTIHAKVINWLAGAVNWLTSAGRNIMTGLWSGIKSMWSSGLSAFGSIKSHVLGWFSGVGSWLVDTGSKVVHGLFNGIKNAFTGVASWAGNLAGEIGKAIKNGLNRFLHLPIKIPKINTHIPGIGKIGGQTLIPRLAKGGLTSAPVFMAGDNPGGKELVTPLESPRTVTLLAAAMRKAGAGASGGGGGGDTFNIYEATNGRQVALEVSRQQRMAGRI